MVPSPSSNRWLAVLGGIVAILFGLFAFVMPGTIVASLVIAFAAFVIIDALILLAGGFTLGDEWKELRLILVAGAVIALILAGLALWNPVGFALTITLLIGIWMLVSSIIQAIAGVALRPVPFWWVMVLSGVIGVIVALYIITQPVAGTVVLVWALGLYAVIYGVGRVLQGIAPGPGSGQATL